MAALSGPPDQFLPAMKALIGCAGSPCAVELCTLCSVEPSVVLRSSEEVAVTYDGGLEPVPTFISSFIDLCEFINPPVHACWPCTVSVYIGAFDMMFSDGLRGCAPAKS